MRLTPKILFVLLVILYPGVAICEEPDKDLHIKCLYPTVELNADSGGTSSGIILISQKEKDKELYKNVGISVSHGCPDRSVIVKVFTYKNWSEIEYTTNYRGIVYYSNVAKDLAVFMFVSDKPIPTAKLAPPKTILYAGQEVIKIGCGLADPPRIDKGIISGIERKFLPLSTKVQLSLYTLPGDSGSAIFNKDLEIVGITVGIRVDKSGKFPYTSIGFATNIKELYTIMEEEDGGLDFLTDGKLPILPWMEIKTKTAGKDNRAIPENPWINKKYGNIQ